MAKKTTKKTVKKTTKKTTKKTVKKTTKKTTKKTAKKTTEKTAKKTTKKTTKKTVKKTEEPTQEKQLTKEEQEQKEKEEKEQKEKERIEEFKKAGEIAKKLKEYIRPKIKVGAKLIDLIIDAENKIKELGGKPGFPVNICRNHIAAHYTSPPGDETVIEDGDIVKFDFGVHTGKGYVVDTAFTVSFNKEEHLANLVKASEEAVKTAISIMKPGMKTNHVGNVIEKKIKEYNYKPIKELMGHKIEQWNLHGGKEIPCVSTPPGSGQEIEEGEVFAVEVFTTNGEGSIHAQTNVQIYNLRGVRIPLRNKKAKKIYSYIANEYQTLPFSKLQIAQEFPQALFGLLEIIRSKKLVEHNVLSEKKNMGIYVAQTEETVLITKDGAELLTN